MEETAAVDTGTHGLFAVSSLVMLWGVKSTKNCQEGSAEAGSAGERGRCSHTASIPWGRGHSLPPGILVASSLSVPDFTPSNPLPSVFPYGGFK